MRPFGLVRSNPPAIGQLSSHITTRATYHRPIPPRNRRLQTPTTPSIVKSLSTEPVMLKREVQVTDRGDPERGGDMASFKTDLVEVRHAIHARESFNLKVTRITAGGGRRL